MFMDLQLTVFGRPTIFILTSTWPLPIVPPQQYLSFACWTWARLRPRGLRTSPGAQKRGWFEPGACSSSITKRIFEVQIERNGNQFDTRCTVGDT